MIENETLTATSIAAEKGLKPVKNITRHSTNASIDHEKELYALCKPRLRAIHDTMDLLSGKWKVAIIGYLHTMGKCRFMQLQRNIEGIGAKMLSKELKDLEINELLTRTVVETRPATVEYELTDYGKTLQNIINELCSWGYKHRERILNKQSECTCEDPEHGCDGPKQAKIA